METTSNDDVFISGCRGNCHDATKTTTQVRDHLLYTFDIPLFIYLFIWNAIGVQVDPVENYASTMESLNSTLTIEFYSLVEAS